MPIPAIIGSLATGTANVVGNHIQQRLASKTKYDDLIAYGRSVGATPSALVAGVTGTAGGSSIGSANSMPDLGNTLNQSVSAAASEKQAQAAADEAAAAGVRAETDRQLGLMRLKFEPRKYLADVQKALSEAFRNTKEAFLHGSMKQYYDELTKDIVQVRPWKIAGLRQGLLNDMATYDKIVQETKTSKALQGYYETGSDLNRANTSLTYSQSLNESLRGFRLQWENSLLSYGIDPNKPFWENTARLMYSNPFLFQKRMDMFISSLNVLDGRLQENLGDHYKRNIALGIGAYQFNKIHQQNANNRAYRFGVFGNTISSFIPFAGGSQPAPVGFKR